MDEIDQTRAEEELKNVTESGILEHFDLVWLVIVSEQDFCSGLEQFKLSFENKVQSLPGR